MKKLRNISLENQISKLIHENSYEIKLFVILFAFNILIYGQKLFFYNITSDDYLRYYLDNDTRSLISASGRWAQVLLNKYVFQGPLHVLPYIHGIVGILSFTLMGFFTAKYFKQNETSKIAVITLLISVTPMVGHNLLFNTNITAWSTSALGLIGFYLAYKKNIVFKVTGFAFLVFAIGNYQSIVQILLIMIAFKALIELLNSETIISFKKIVFNAIIYGLFVIVAFYISSKINHMFIQYYHLNGASTRVHFINNLFNFNVILNMYKTHPAFDYFNLQLNYLYFSSFILFIFSILYRMIIQSKKNFVTFLQTILIILIILIIPILVNLPLIGDKHIFIHVYFPIGWVLAGGYLIQIQIFKGIFKTLSNIIIAGIFITSVYYISIFYDTATRQFNADLIRANLMVERIRTHKNYTSEPLKLGIYGGKEFSVVGWKRSWQQGFNSGLSKYKIIKYFTDLKFKEIGNSDLEDVIDYLVKIGEPVSSYPGKNSVVVYQDKAVIFLDARYANKRINTAKLHKKKPDINATYNIYLQDNIIFYKKYPCIKADTSNFILKLYPDMEDRTVRNTLNISPILNWDFRFHNYGILKDNTCIAARILPDIKINKITVGQFNQNGKLWQKTLYFKDNTQHTRLINSINVKNTKHDVKYYIEKYSTSSGIIKISGWAFARGSKTENIRKYIVLHNEYQSYYAEASPVIRLDVANSFKNDLLNFSGFEATIYKNDFPSGTYDIGILLIENENDQQHLIKTNKHFEIKKE